MINIILCCYKRVFNLPLILKSLNEQTVSDKIILHILNNNYNDKKIIEHIILRFNRIKIILKNYNNNNNVFERFIYARELKKNNIDIKYVIFIDDDMIYYNDWVEKMNKLREPKTFVSWYIKKYNLTNKNNNYITDSSINKIDLIYNKKKDIIYSNYGGPGGSICDIEIFMKNDFFKLPYNKVKYMDDIWISYFISTLIGWKIKRSFLPPIMIKKINKNQITLFDQYKYDKQEFFKYLIDKGWK